MIIGIDGSRAFIKKRTGIEEYSYQVIKNLREFFKEENVRLYIKKNQEIDFVIPDNWQVRKLCFPRLWTQVRLSWELLLYPVDTLFVPAHTVPIVHPKKTVVVIHGLEYEFCKSAYSFWQRFYMRTVIRKSCEWASDIICVSNNTKGDIMKLYGVSPGKIRVIYEGYNQQLELERTVIDKQLGNRRGNDFARQDGKAYFLFVGRIEERKNVLRIAEAFSVMKQKYGGACKLTLVGKPGYGYEHIKKSIDALPDRGDIEMLGYITEQQKWDLLAGARAFVFPTLYEGFGIPILEAQSMMVPVICSNNSSIPEVAGEGAILVDPAKTSEIAEAMWVCFNNEHAREDLIKKGFANVKRFSWFACAKEISQLVE